MTLLSALTGWGLDTILDMEIEDFAAWLEAATAVHDQLRPKI